MIRFRAILAVGAAAGALIAAAAAPAAEYIPNGTFEGGSTSGWTAYNASLSVVTGGHSGARSMRAARTTSNWFSVTTSPRPVTSTTAGVTYTGRAWVRSTIPRRTCIRVREWSSSAVGSAEACVTTSSSWQLLAVDYTALGSGRALDLSVHEPSAGSSDWFQVDDVSLVNVPPADTTPPDTRIDAGPSGTTSATTATFSFSATETATFECALDGAAYAACTSPRSYTGLSSGPHTFSVRARDAAGNVDATPATRSWTVDAVAPETALTARPPATTSATTATFTFSSSEVGTFECSLDASPYAACTSPKSYTAVAAGPHTFSVRARDAAGNVDASPATASWTVDDVAPDTTITSSPPATTASTTAEFSFTSSEAGTFECSLDAAAYTACTSPQTYSGVANGSHNFSVRARDAAGNLDQSAATFSWTVGLAPDSTPPDTRIDSGPQSPTAQTTATFSFSATEPATFECSLDGAPFAACSSPTTYSSLSNAAHTFSVRARDEAGNLDDSPASWTWTVEPPAPTPVPETTLTSQPAAVSAAAVVAFGFTSSDPSAGFECSLDGAAFTPCASPRQVETANGQHRFAVRAVNAGGADASPASATWWTDALLAGGTFEASLEGWTNFTVAGWKGYNATLARATDGVAGGSAGKATYAGGSSFSVYAAPKPVNATIAGATYVLDGLVRSDTPGRTVCLRLREYGVGASSGAVVGFAQKCLTATTAWAAVPTVSYVAAGGGDLDVDAFQSNAAVTGDSFELDRVTLADGATRATTPAQGGDPHLIAVGDIASCYMSGDDWTARLVDGLDGQIQSLGDNAYDHGSAAELNGCFGTTWGRFIDRYHPTPGDHEYDSGTADAYFDYFGAAAGERGKGWYSYDVGGWHVVVTNTGNCAGVGGCQAGSPQVAWLQADLAAHPVDCTVAVIDEPRFSSGNVHGSEADMQDMWQVLYAAGADVVLSGDDHVYERFAPQTPTGTADSAYGLREFVVGTGGYSHYGFGTPVANSEVRNSDTFGVLQLTLRAGAYDWRFVGQSGRSFSDAGSGSCHGAPADAIAPSVSLTSPAAGSTVSGSVTLAADAADDRGVTSVEFFAGQTLVGTDSDAPYAVTWDTTSRADGSVQLTARARDAAGNTTTSAVRTVTVRNAAASPPPETTLGSGPASSTTDTNASFSFTGTGSSFECALDSAAWSACTSPKSYTGLAGGSHTFAVRALAADGTPDPSPATWGWSIAAPTPGNLIANGGFEGTLAGWYGYRATLTLVAGRTGANGARSTLSGSGSSFSIITSPVPVSSATAGTSYTASAWVRSDTPGKSVCLRIRETAGGVATGAQTCATGTTAWQQLTVTYRVQTGGSTIDVYAFLNAPVAGDSFDVDDVLLR